MEGRSLNISRKFEINSLKMKEEIDFSEFFKIPRKSANVNF